jgi:hypothetical protein
MSKNWIIVFPSVLFLYVFFQAAMVHNDFCDTTIEFPKWVLRINFFVVFWFFVNSLLTSYALIVERNSKNGENIPPLVANLVILLIAGSSSYLTLQYRWGGVCRDIYG